MKPEQIEAIKRRAEKATPGKWTVHPIHKADSFKIATDETEINGGDIWTKEDAEFIAASREDVPELVAEVEKLRGLLSSAAERLDSFWDCGPPGEEYRSEELEALLRKIRGALGEE